MIPKTAFCAISLIMGVSCAFGFVMRGILDKAINDHIEANKRRREDDYNADIDNWEDDQ